MSRLCSNCTAPITPRGKTGLCRACIWNRTIADPEFQRRRVEGLRGPAFKPGRHCRDCEVSLGPRNSTGLCLPCFNKDPEHTAKRARGVSAWISRSMQDPAFAEKVREHGRWLGKSGTGNAATPAGSEPRRRAGQTLSACHLAWCPPEYRAFYRKQIRRLRFAGPARRATFAKIEEDKRAVAEELAKLSPFERQMHALKNGARLVEKPVFHSRSYDFTLGGVSSMEGV